MIAPVKKFGRERLSISFMENKHGREAFVKLCKRREYFTFKRPRRVPVALLQSWTFEASGINIPT